MIDKLCTVSSLCFLLISLLTPTVWGVTSGDVSTDNETTSATRTTREVTYEGYQVLRVHAESMDQLLYLRELSDTSETGHAQINFWSEPNSLNSSVDFMVSPEYETEIKAILKKQNMETETLINDVGR